jgi:hypothetical protein
MNRAFEKARRNVPVPARVAGGASLAYVVWGLVPVWFHCCSTATPGAGAVKIDVAVSGALTTFPTAAAFVMAVVAFAGVAAIAAGLTVEGTITAGTIEVVVTGAVVAGTILGFAIAPHGWTVQWGFFVGLFIAAVAVFDRSGALVKRMMAPPGASDPTTPEAGSPQAKWLKDVCVD